MTTQTNLSSRVKSAHYLSGIFLIAFSAIHIMNHLAILFSVEAHLAFMDAYRVVYRFPLIEILLVCAILIQVTTGGKLLWQKWPQGKTPWERLQVLSGGYFLYFLIAHPAAVFFGRYVWHLDTNLFFGAAVLNISPIHYFFMFHYGIALVAFFAHVACVHRQKMQSYVTMRMATFQALLIIFLGIILSFLIVGNMMGIPIPQEYLDGYSY